MPKRKKVSKANLVKVASDAIAGVSKRDLMKKYPAVSERVIRLLMQNEVGADEWRTALIGEIQSTAGEALLELRKAIREGRYSPNSLPIAFGVLLDKCQAIEGRAVLRDASINLMVNNYGTPDRVALLAELAGLSSTPRKATPIEADMTVSIQASSNPPPRAGGSPLSSEM